MDGTCAHRMLQQKTWVTDPHLRCQHCQPQGPRHPQEEPVLVHGTGISTRMLSSSVAVHMCDREGAGAQRTAPASSAQHCACAAPLRAGSHLWL